MEFLFSPMLSSASIYAFQCMFYSSMMNGAVLCRLVEALVKEKLMVSLFIFMFEIYSFPLVLLCMDGL
jgi:hypothetical protein